jgi:RNA polymerase sigma-70 factor, ECF subfamily
MGTDLQNPLDEYAKTQIRVRARQLIRKPGFTSSDREDIEQELTLHLLQHIGKHDATRGCLHTFVSRIIKNKAASIIRQRHALRRDPDRNECSLDELSDLEELDAGAGGVDGDEEENMPALQTDFEATAVPEKPKRIDRSRMRQPTVHPASTFAEPAVDERELNDLRIDLQEAMNSLPADLRALAELLRDWTAEEAARKTGQSRDTIRRQIRELRRHFEERGLGDYLPVHQSDESLRK